MEYPRVKWLLNAGSPFLPQGIQNTNCSLSTPVAWAVFLIVRQACKLREHYTPYRFSQRDGLAIFNDEPGKSSSITAFGFRVFGIIILLLLISSKDLHTNSMFCKVQDLIKDFGQMVILILGALGVILTIYVGKFRRSHRN